MRDSPIENAVNPLEIMSKGFSASALTVVEGNLANNRLPLTLSVATVGADPSCDIWLPYPEVSPFHAVLARTPQGWWVRQVNPSHPIAVNGKTTTGAILSGGDRLAIGRLILELVDHPQKEIARENAPSFDRLHAAILAARHVEALELSWVLESRERRLAQRARRIAARLKEMAKPHDGENGALSPPDPKLENDESLRIVEEKLALEKARLNRLRVRLLDRWKKQRARAGTPVGKTGPEFNPLRPGPVNYPDQSRREVPAPAPSTLPQGSCEAATRAIAILEERKADLLQELAALAARGRGFDLSMGPGAKSTAQEDVLLVANLMTRHHAEWERDAQGTIKALEREQIALAQREHLVAEREALLETLLGQRSRQREELELSIHGAAQETRLANIRAESSEIEADRLRHELRQLTDSLNHRLSPANPRPETPVESWQDLVSRIDELASLLAKAGDWACQDLNASERAELEFLRFNSAMVGLSHDKRDKPAVRTMVEMACESIRTTLIPAIEEAIQAHQADNEPPDRRLLIEAHRWRIRAESLDNALRETRSLIRGQDRIPGDGQSNRAA